MLNFTQQHNYLNVHFSILQLLHTSLDGVFNSVMLRSALPETESTQNNEQVHLNHLYQIINLFRLFCGQQDNMTTTLRKHINIIIGSVYSTRLREEHIWVWMGGSEYYKYKTQSLMKQSSMCFPLVLGKITAGSTCSVPMWLRCDDALVICPQRDTIQTVSSSTLLHMLCRSLSRILEKVR